MPVPEEPRGGGRLSLVMTLLGGFLILVVGGAAFYFTWQNQRELREEIPSQVSPTALPSPTPTATPTPTPYVHADGFSLTPPLGWAADTGGKLGADVIFTSQTPDMTPEGSLVPPNLLVVARATPKAGVTLDAAVARTKATLPRLLKGYTSIDDARVRTVSGEPAHILGGTYREAQLTLRNKQLIFVKDGKIYTLTGSGLASVWEAKQYNALFDVALTSLAVAGPSPSPTAPPVVR
ncbi:MAG: hypothetical protein G01um101438_745 [Parcubacteria group bacterium Gr01-1014_38]|nr:MAG: hypothetical protein G01um101438_745 [Parcubacteria group bacterium Gr01-1014_38]